MRSNISQNYGPMGNEVMDDSGDNAGAAREAKRTSHLALIFWVATYSIMTFRGRLAPDGPLEWLSWKRLLTITLGTALYVIAVRHLDRLSARPFSMRVFAGAAWAAAATAALFGTRWALAEFSVEPFDAPGNLRWLLVWLGYFLAWISIYLALNVYERPMSRADSESLPLDEDRTSEEALWVQTNKQSVRVPMESVEWFEAEGNYIRVHASETTGLVRGSLAKLEKRLDSGTFVRVHRAVICRRSSIRALKRTSTGAMRAALESGIEVPVGRALGKRVVEAIRSQRM